MQTITLEFLREKNACREGVEYWQAVNKPDLFDFIHQCRVDDKLDYANWLIVRCMTKPQYVGYAIYGTELVVKPDDEVSLRAIEAARAVLLDDSAENRAAAWAAADAAAWATAAAWAAGAASAEAAWAAEAAGDAGDAAWAAAAAWAEAAWAAEAAGDAGDAKKEMLWKILEHGMKLMRDDV